MKREGALAGLKVLDISRLLPGPYCSMVLADHGAEVISVEDRKFQNEGMFFPDLYRNKRHISLNLKTDAGREIFYRLADKADIILEGFRPGVVARLGVDYESVKKRNPGIIYCSITGYGQTGPYRDRAGHDANYLCSAGVLDMIGEKGGIPVIPGVQIADISGGMSAVTGILLALIARGKNGEGQYVDISMTDCLLGMMMLPALLKRMSGKKIERSNYIFSHRFACYSTFETADGRHLAIGALERRFWVNLCTHLNVPEFIDLQFDEERRKDIIARFREIFRTKTLQEWDEDLDRTEVCHSAVKSMDELYTMPLFQQRDMILEYTQKDGQMIKTFATGIKLCETPGALRNVPPEFGGDTEEVLAEIGYSAADIARFTESGAI